LVPSGKCRRASSWSRLRWAVWVMDGVGSEAVSVGRYTDVDVNVSSAAF